MVNEIKKEISRIQTYREGVELFNHKPLLLLLIFSDIKKGRKSPVYKFEELDERLSTLLKKYSGPKTDPKNAHYPFVFLRSSALWRIEHIDFKIPKVPHRHEVMGKTGTFNEFVFNYLIENLGRIDEVIYHVLTEFWPNKLHSTIVKDLEKL